MSEYRNDRSGAKDAARGATALAAAAPGARFPAAAAPEAVAPEGGSRAAYPLAADPLAAGPLAGPAPARPVPRAAVAPPAVARPAIANPGESCWCRPPAGRAAFLIDGAAYFSALRAALIAAERSIVVVGWELHSRTVLDPNHPPDAILEDGWPNCFFDFLQALTAEKEALEVHILLWNFAVIYSLERELVSPFGLPWQANPRIHFVKDDRHPFGASHHQKIVVVDDRIAFVGGLDVTTGRWDTPEHRPIDPRRSLPNGATYRPFHDVQMAVDGEAAAALGELVRRRWQRATGEALAAPRSTGDPWPAWLIPDVTDIPVAIARAEPAYGGQPAVREVELLYLASLRAARRFVYIENQFLTATGIGAAMMESLAAEEGPEFVLVLPAKSMNMLEESSMGVARGRLLKQLREADRHGRLAVYCPTLGGGGGGAGGGCDIKVHSKVMVVDDRFARVGSSNLANRSMGLDTECDLAIETEGAETEGAETEGAETEGIGETEGGAEVAEAILGLRNRLLAEHLDCSPEQVAAAVVARGSLIGAVEALRGTGRSLIPVEDSLSELLDQIVPATKLLDPGSPMQAEELAHRLLHPEGAEGARAAASEGAEEETGEMPRSALRKLWLFALLLAMSSALVLAWTFTPLSRIASVEGLQQWVAAWHDEPVTPLLVMAAYLIGGLLAFPIIALISLTGALFGPLWGFVYGLAGSLLSATMLFWLGALLGREGVQRLGGASFNRISQRLGKHGILTVTVLSVLPLAPFSLVNLAIGASHITFRDFVIGTLIGMVPGMYALVIFGDRLINALVAPSAGTVALLCAALLVLLAVTYGSRLWLARRRRDRPGPDPER